MKKKISAGLVLYRRSAGKLEVLLVHPGGPLWAKRDLGAWSIPKGEVSGEEDLLQVARREFREELGSAPPGGTYLRLGSINQKGGKTVYGWAVEGDLDADAAKSNHFTMEWPPRSGREQEFPEVDRAAFFSLEEATRKINEAQIPFLERTERLVK